MVRNPFIGRDRPSYPLSVLVVDEAPDATDSMAILLTLHGHAVRIARSGEDALRLAAADPPDVVLLDLLMSDLHGWEVARRLRDTAVGKQPFLVAVTGCATAVDRRRSAEAGIDLHLVKPVAPTVLVGLLWRFARVFAPTIPADPLGPWPDESEWSSPPEDGDRCRPAPHELHTSFTPGRGS
jgi:DNA-binding response OmpR family regulator